MFKEKQIHIQIGCADARDLNQLQVEEVQNVTREFRNKGVDVEFHIIRAAGSFLSPDVVMDVKRTFEQAQRSTEMDVKMSYYVHIQTHGHLTEDSSDQYISHVHELTIVDGSPLNCGMLKASQVAVEVERMIVTEKLEVDIRGEKVVIDNDTKIKLLLKEHYAYDGYLAGDWIKSIDLLRTHPRHQRTVLEKAIDNDPDLKMLNIQITCGILDYSIHSLIRVDDGEPAVPFWDIMQKRIREKAKNDRGSTEALILQSQKQKPLAGLLCMSDPRQSSRLYAADYYLHMKGVESNGEYLPNTVFNITGSSFDIPQTPFGPYVIAGFYFSVAGLGLTDQMVMGYDRTQTARIMQKIKNDPIMSLIIKKFDVNLIPLNHIDLMPKQ
jgi:hypothetical protein